MVQKLIDKHGHTKIIVAAVLIGLASGFGGALIFTPIYVAKKLNTHAKLVSKERQQQQAVFSSIDNKLTIHDALLDTLKTDLTCISISDSLEQIRRICDMEVQLDELLHRAEKLTLQAEKRADKIQQIDNQTRQHIEKLENDIEKLDKEQLQQLRSIRNSINDLEDKILNVQRRLNTQ